MLRKIRSRLPLRRCFLHSLSIYHDWAICVSGFSSYCSLSVLLVFGFGIGDIVEGTTNGGGSEQPYQIWRLPLDFLVYCLPSLPYFLSLFLYSTLRLGVID